MKIAVVMLLFAALTIFTSCTKDDTEPTQPSNQNNNNVLIGSWKTSPMWTAGRTDTQYLQMEIYNEDSLDLIYYTDNYNDTDIIACNYSTYGDTLSAIGMFDGDPSDSSYLLWQYSFGVDSLILKPLSAEAYWYVWPTPNSLVLLKN